MELHNLKPAKGSVKNKKRVGRGQGSTRGGTSTRGHKGAQSRSGYSRKKAFEGGQMPLQRRVPKFGFKNRNRKEYVGFNLDRVCAIAEKYDIANDFSVDALKQHGLIQRGDLVKILGGGELDRVVNFRVNGVTASAREAIEAKGGTLDII